MKSKTWFGLAMAGMLGALAWGAMPSSVAAADQAAPACGSKDNPCPMQKWMKANLGAALAGNDLQALAKSLDKSATFSPDPSWEWAAIAKAGADAARKGDVAGAKASCKTCHDKYKDSYKSKFRTKAVN
ncbi:hypothetical protein LZC95_18825 [Pendulispora brunnea]|uniref:Cytochrome c n=1 Tax=Pendulispora brunnea TaxID=2905690 RepID=A0ABZ2KJZ1_9BACT